MSRVVAILEDDSGRIDEMRACLARFLSGAKCIFFDRADEMRAWLEQHLSEVVLISLDHDLPLRGLVGQSIDCGTGRQIAASWAEEVRRYLPDGGASGGRHE